jgi:hypothetical protein
MYSMNQPFAETDRIFKRLQVDYDIMIRTILGKYQYFPGFTLFLGHFLQCTKARRPEAFTPRIIASLYLIRGEGHILNEMGLCGLWNMRLPPYTCTVDFLTYFEELLEDPERSKTYFFDQQRYMIASKESLKLYLCNHRNFSNKVMVSENVLRRNKPWLWRGRLGVHSKIRKGRHYFKVRQLESLKCQIAILTPSFPDHSPEHEYCRFLSYQWALDLLPFFLEKSAVSLELAEALRRCTFTTMAQRFPRRMRLAKAAITRYLLGVESGVNNM